MLRLQQCSATVLEIPEKSILEKHAACTSYFICSECLTGELHYVKLGAVLFNFCLTSKTAAFISDLKWVSVPERWYIQEKILHATVMSFFNKLLVLICSIPEDLIAVIFSKAKEFKFWLQGPRRLPFCWKTRQPLKFMLHPLCVTLLDSKFYVRVSPASESKLAFDL